ncbi:hypothetical protein M409DRAFT_20726 [Zasmidium cellare ATCC 36951]|uniref:FAD-binding domain-containing protein n=1 Tax=Zasmidium cellare ATCC 36951 TaxID=1080233 RepID=A0A6A6CSG4_ZASCE|nr:uncharacterized protein M409DRAFT_20726 [Zasmidium cellare ATCC 36951]KAF2168709.1 hypothetical protein M409DRAFT_20726 [Zasmidium cellare ATCC 36951]
MAYRSENQHNDDADIDVGVVGYGPTGMVFAILMALKGFRVCVYERHKERWNAPRHGHVDGQIMRIMQDIGIALDVEKIARALTEFEVHSAEGETLQSLKTADGDGSGWKRAYMMSSVELEDHLDIRARNLGVRVIMGHQVSNLEQDSTGVNVTSINTSDQSLTQSIRARYVVGSDGANSFVRRHLGIPQTEIPFSHPEHLVIDFEHFDPDLDIPNLQGNAHVLSSSRQYLAGRWEGGRWSRWEFARKEGERVDELQKLSTCWKLLAPWGVGPEDGVTRRHSVYAFEARIAKHWREDRIFLMGNAAHTMPPYMGQGMCSGARDAANLAWKLSAVLDNTVGPELLDTYKQERKSHVEDITKLSIGIGTALKKAYQMMSESPQAAGSFQVAQPPEFPRITGGCLLGSGELQCVGRPMLQGRVLHQGRVALLGDFLPGGRTIITGQRLPKHLFDSRQRQVLVKYDVTVAHVSRGASAQYVNLEGDYDVWYRTHKRKAVLVRPDHYIFNAAEHPDDAVELVDQLRAAMESFERGEDDSSLSKQG